MLNYFTQIYTNNVKEIFFVALIYYAKKAEDVKRKVKLKPTYVD